MNLQYAGVLADGLFAGNVIKTIKNQEYDEDCKNLLEYILRQTQQSINGKQASQNFTADKNTLDTLRAYGKAISVVQSLDIEDEIDCVEKYLIGIKTEVKNALEHKKILVKSMTKTLDYYKQQRNSSIENGSRFNINIRTGDMWQRATQF